MLSLSLLLSLTASEDKKLSGGASVRPSPLLSKPCVRFSGAGAALRLWDLKTLRFELEQVPRNPISWQSQSLRLQRWPSSASAAGAAALQLCTGRGARGPSACAVHT